MIKFNETSDLALLKLTTIPKGLEPIKISKVIPKVGDSVHAVGHPHGEMWSYSKGYISAHRTGILMEKIKMCIFKGTSIKCKHQLIQVTLEDR